jgi:HSP20 family molecular chaperone IbpA
MSAVNLHEVRRAVTEGVAGWDDEDIAVRLEETALQSLHVTISSRHPSAYYTQ